MSHDTALYQKAREEDAAAHRLARLFAEDLEDDPLADYREIDEP